MDYGIGELGYRSRRLQKRGDDADGCSRGDPSGHTTGGQERGHEMIVWKAWHREYKKGIWRYSASWCGWFLFGFIPLYMRRYEFTKKLS